MVYEFRIASYNSTQVRGEDVDRAPRKRLVTNHTNRDRPIPNVSLLELNFNKVAHTVTAKQEGENVGKVSAASVFYMPLYGAKQPQWCLAR